MTHNEDCIETLKKCLGKLSGLAALGDKEADELCDHIVGLVSQIQCRYEFPNCPRTATELAYSRRFKEVIRCCERCASTAVNEDGPEYVDYCANCGCRSPIN